MPESAGSVTTAITVTVLFALLAALAALCRYGLDTAPRSDLLETARRKRREQRVRRALDEAHKVLSLVLLLESTSMAVVAISLHQAVAPAFPRFEVLAAAAAAIVAGLLLLFVGRFLPRAVRTDRLYAFVVLALPALHRLAWPFGLAAPIVEKVRRRLDRALGNGGRAQMRDTFEDAVIAAVERAKSADAIDEEEADVVENVVQLREIEVCEIMTPRTDVRWVRHDESIAGAVSFAARVGHSRLPVAQEDLDHVVGVFYVRDVLDKLSDFEELADVPVRHIMRKAHFVPEHLSVYDMLRTFQRERLQIAIVTDEFGGTAGLVTIEDVLEEIVGEIIGEQDLARDSEPVFRRIGERTFEVDGRWRIEELNEELGIAIPESEDYDTLAGFLLERFERVPEENEAIEWQGIRFVVIAKEGRRIRRVRIELPRSTPEPVESEAR